MKEGDRVHVRCPDRDRGELCRQWGYTSLGTVALRRGRRLWLQGEPVGFSRRHTGRWVRVGYPAEAGPYLELCSSPGR
jgi:hypothetical protein